jgi:hypothetical protein
MDELRRDYALIAEIYVEAAPKIQIYVRHEDARPRFALAAEDYVSAYNQGATAAHHVSHHVSHLAFDGDVHVLEPKRDFDDVARLLAYEIDPDPARPGQMVRITLYWQALSSPERNYQVFTHLVRQGDLVAQHDGAPACAFSPTSLWEAGEFVRDEHMIWLGEDLAPGEVDLYVGVYDLLTLARLSVVDSDEDRVFLQSVRIADAD